MVPKQGEALGPVGLRVVRVVRVYRVSRVFF